jgi:hypothetical protein
VLCVLLLARRTAAVEVPGTAGRVVAGGWLDGLAVAETEGGPSQGPGALLDVHVDAEAARWLRAHVDLRTRVGGPLEGGHLGFLGFDHAFQNRSPSFEPNEAYADVHLHQADLRLGVQKVAWGKLDGIPPTDVVNPRDYHDPLVQDFEERKIGIPMLLGTYYLPDVPRLDMSGLRATLLWAPIAVPSRLALAEERWFPSSTVPPAQVTVPPSRLPPPLRPLLPDGVVIPVQFGTLNHRPPRQLEDGAIGVRVGGTWRDTDWDIYHYTGPETGPDADLQITLKHPRAMLLPLRATSLLRQAHDMIHMTGADASAVFGGLTVRAEAAHFDDRPYLRVASDLIPEAERNFDATQLLRHPERQSFPVPVSPLFPALDAVEWGIGADYLIHGWQPLLQVNQIVLLERAPRLLIHDPETRLSGTVRKRIFAERVELEVKGTYAVERAAWYVFPRVSWLVRDDLRLRLGYLALGGPQLSLIGQFRRNDEVVLEARYSF